MEHLPKIYRPLPEHIKPYAFDFRWSNEKVWALEVPSEKMPVSELEWHFDIQWLHTPGGRFDLKPVDVMNHPEEFSEEYQRTMNSDLSCPIDVMYNRDRWLILDGLHRLMKSVDAGLDEVTVRKIPRTMIPQIEI